MVRNICQSIWKISNVVLMTVHMICTFFKSLSHILSFKLQVIKYITSVEVQDRSLLIVCTDDVRGAFI